MESSNGSGFSSNVRMGKCTIFVPSEIFSLHLINKMFPEIPYKGKILCMQIKKRLFFNWLYLSIIYCENDKKSTRKNIIVSIFT